MIRGQMRPRKCLKAREDYGMDDVYLQEIKEDPGGLHVQCLLSPRWSGGMQIVRKPYSVSMLADGA